MPLKCPVCGKEAVFVEKYGPGDETWLECRVSGCKTDEMEVRLANVEPETEVVQ